MNLPIKFFPHDSSGQSLIELLLAIGIMAIVLPSLFLGLFVSHQGRPMQTQRLEAASLLKEAQEAVRSVRERGWSTFAVNGTYHPALSGSQWILSSGAESINGFTRSIVIGDIYRDENGAVATTGGILDPSTKAVDITVSWNSPFSASVASRVLVTRYLENRATIQTSEADFNTGTKTGTTVVNNSGGEVILGAGGNGDWCAPATPSALFDLPKNGVANALTAIEGKVFAGTGDNASGVSFDSVLVSNAKPPVPSSDGTFDGYKTNGVFGETNYAYLATDNNSKEIVIIDLTQKVSGKYVEAGVFNAPGNGNGNSIYVSGTVGYMTAGNKLYTFDLTSKSGSRSILDSDGFTLAGTGNKIMVKGGYVFVAIGSSSNQLQIINATNPNNLSEEGKLTLDAGNATDVFVNESGNRAYVVTAESSTKKEFFIVNTSNLASPSLVSSYESNGMSPKGVTVVPGNRAIIVGTSGEEYQVINISNENSPTRCGGVEVNNGVNGVASIIEQDGDAWSYIITGDATTELKIIEGGPGGVYSASGTFESATFDATYPSAFNRIDFTRTQPSQTTISVQVAVADAVNGSCNGVTFNFVGPDGTLGTFYTSSGAFPMNDDGSGYENPGQCMRYKVYFSSTDSSQTPEFNDVTINYSP